MTDKEKASNAGASTGLHDLARQGSNDLDILASEALLKEYAKELRFEYLTWWSAFRPDLSADPALKARDEFWQRILIDPIRAFGFTFPADPMSTEPCRAHVFFVGEAEVSHHYHEAERADLLRIVRRVRNLNARFGCEIHFAPDFFGGGA